ncbi:aldehyde ferredoxin oxidoreductase [Candidatus Bathyarchaeota archaeon]|nr:MAG: aldehyde ferredoxin oxidoreductase [Candidatus Bathyarchaeota archaeon]
MLGAYTGKILRVNLTTRKINMERLDEEKARKFIGGKGLGAKILYDSLKPGVNPLSPENILIFASGPLTATLAPTSARWAVVTKSPLTNIFLDCQVGGYFGAAMKLAGFDCIIVEGKADKPVYLWVHDKNCEILDADFLWGKGCFETEEILKKRLGLNVRVASIGPAGENLVRYACISVDKYRQAGRGGAGAVMGSKNLKAVAVQSSGHKIRYADPEGFRKAANEALRVIKENSFIPLRRKYGTPIWVSPVNKAALLPTKNFRTGVFEKADEISGETMRKKIVFKDGTCYNCIIQCWKYTHVKSGKYKFDELAGPEYESIALLGSNCGVGSIEAVAYANMLCDNLGLDTISTGNTIAFAMECFEKGLLTLKDTDGINLKFGNAEAEFEMIKKIANREGIGNLLGEGVRRASKKIGKGSEKFAMHVKGLEIPGYDPRGAFGMALAYATSDRGACHQRAWTVRAEISGELAPRFSTKGRAKFVKETQDERAMCFSLVLCDFAPLKIEHFVKLLNTATGFNFTVEDYLKTGERIWNLTRLFNVREGITREDDTLPPRFMEEPLPEGVTKGQVVTKEMLNQMLDEYYTLRGWDENGIPTKEKLKELELI